MFLNDRIATTADASARLAAGDVVRVWMDRPGTGRKPIAIGQARDLPILFEDDAVVVLNKPAGVLAVPLARREDARSVFDDLKAYLRARRRRPFVVHRIDRDTSGIVVFAKTAAAQERLKDQFKRHRPQRIYQAVVYGHPTPSSGTWLDRLVWDERALVQKATHPRDPRAKEAISRYRVLERFPSGASLVEISLVTGRRNQIRIQARLRGHTLVGEQRYTFGPDDLRPIDFPRQALHAWRLTFEHPVTGRAIEFEAPLPPDMSELIARLRKS